MQPQATNKCNHEQPTGPTGRHRPRLYAAMKPICRILVPALLAVSGSWAQRDAVRYN
jgi:hypothetical protein